MFLEGEMTVIEDFVTQLKYDFSFNLPYGQLNIALDSVTILHHDLSSSFYIHINKLTKNIHIITFF